MADDNPYKAPVTRRELQSDLPKPGTSLAPKIGTVILLLGVAVLTYGALAFFVINSLPPNGGAQGRLPSLYVLFSGMGAMLVGAVVRGLRIR